MAYKLFNPGCECCGCAVGFEFDVWGDVLDCLPNGTRTITNVRNDIDQLDQCCFLYAGCRTCSQCINFFNADWPKIKEWIERGGRMYLAGEYIFETTHCMADRARFNSFLLALGSSMSIGTTGCNCGCYGVVQSGEAGIAQGIEISLACTNEILGGVSVAITKPEEDPGTSSEDCSEPIVGIAVEQLGEGLLMVAGDSNLFIQTPPCHYNNCGLVTRWHTWKTADIL